MIDVHCHLFNSRYLPIKGVLRSRGLPRGLAGALEKAIHGLADEDPALAPRPAKWSVAKALALPTPPAQDRRSHKARMQAMFDALPDRTVESKVVRDWLDKDEARAARVKGRRAGTVKAQGLREVRERLKDWIADKVVDKLDNVPAAVNFLVDLARPERELFERLHDISDGVELFVHHMMDMQYGYDDDPAIPWDRQIQRMRRLSQLYAENPRIKGFVAFDPFRPGSLRQVKTAIEKFGFIGVKYYASTGYVPVDNTTATLQKHLRKKIGMTGAKVDERTRKMLDYCLEGDIPIMAHCTSVGMESVPGKSGVLADPTHWVRLFLREPRYANLRLCLAHAGGAAGWMYEPNLLEESAYSNDVIAMCVAYPNVYCDLSCLGEIMKKKGNTFFRKRMRKILTSSSWAPLRDKMMYGSDYPMMMDGRGWKGYLPAFRDAIGSLGDPAFSDAFFEGNATQFLRLT